jgi:2-iminobutanoate/2-iminopropanoate deaminase
MLRSKKESRRGFLAGLAAIVTSGLGAGTLLARGRQQASTPQMPLRGGRGGRGRPHGPMTHNGLIFISGIGANDRGKAQAFDIKTHTTKVMETIKRVVEAGGGTMDSILQLNVYLATLEDYQGMNEVYYSYFKNGGPARCTVAVAGVPGDSLLEINGLAAVVNPPEGS